MLRNSSKPHLNSNHLNKLKHHPHRWLIISVGALFWITGLTMGYSSLPDQLSPQGAIDPQTIASATVASPAKAIFNNREVPVPVFRETDTYQYPVLGDTASGEVKHIEIDLSHQRLYAYEGDRQVFNFLISSGKWGRTPTGRFRIWTKLKSTRMQGGSQALGTYYNLPNVPYTMFFYNDKIAMSRGYGIHGTYWHSNFGHPMSHGCINMKTEEAEQVYYWAMPDSQGKSTVRATDDNPGTEIVIYGIAPTI